MKKIGIYLLVIFTGGILFYVLTLTGYIKPDQLLYYYPCEKPITYKIGTVDTRFQLSKQEFLAAMNEGAELWDSATGRDLFTYDPKGELTVNLIYDQRQFLTNQIEGLKQKLDTEENDFTPKREEFDRLSADFTKRLNELNTKIDYWNSQGGAPADEFDKIIAEQKSLQEESLRLKDMAATLNASADAFNTQVGELNQTVDTFNTALKTRPEEGIYIGSENKIEVYFNKNKEELVHTLAHEFGHSRGVGHIDNEASIMYHYTSDSTTLTPEDITEMQKICEPISRLQILSDRINHLVNQLRKN